MTTKELQQIVNLTEKNNHTEARIAIAKSYKLYEYQILFEAIKAIHHFEHSLPFAFGLYRDNKTEEMLELIKNDFGEEEVGIIYKVI